MPAPGNDAPAASAVVEAILKRRSVREGWDGRPVPLDVLETVLRCGLAAPSSKNARPWRFHVVQDRAVLRRIADAAVGAEGAETWVPHDPSTGQPSPHWRSTVAESADVLAAVPCGIVIENRGVFSGGVEALSAATLEGVRAGLAGYGFECMGVGAALENLWLAANALGLQVAFLGDLAIVGGLIRAELGIEGDVMGVVGLGHSAMPPAPRRPAPEETQPDRFVVWH